MLLYTYSVTKGIVNQKSGVWICSTAMNIASCCFHHLLRRMFVTIKKKYKRQVISEGTEDAELHQIKDRIHECE